MRPRIGITAGDPAGIGPEIALKVAAHEEIRALCEPIVYGPSSPAEVADFAGGVISAAAGRAAYEAVVKAVADATSGAIDAIATAPINKEAFAAAGIPWPGHTDLLAHLTGARRVAMMFYADTLRVVLATVHVPLRDVPTVLTRARLEDTIDLTAAELPQFGHPSPRLAVAGLNPHAGEHGLLGAEEDDVLRPAIAACAARGIDVRGPFPADTLFNRAMKGRVRRGRRLLPRSGPDPGEAGGVRAGRERHAGAADHPDLGRSRDGVRHRRPRDRGSVQPDRGGAARGTAGDVPGRSCTDGLKPRSSS